MRERDSVRKPRFARRMIRREGRFRRGFRGEGEGRGREKGLRLPEFPSENLSPAIPWLCHQSLLQSVEPESQLDELSQSLSESVVE